MHSFLTRAALPAALLTSIALAPASADAAKKTDWLYDVTVTAEMSEEWRFREEAHSGDDVEPCDRYQEAQGSAHITLRTRRPHRMMVMRGMNGQPPMLNVGTGEGAPLVGAYKRDGFDKTRHEGPRCGPGNPPFEQPTTGCGTQPFKADFALVYKTKRTVGPAMLLDDLREDCPAGPSHGVDWDGGVVPQIGEATSTVAPSRFYGTKQFTIRGGRTFTGLVNPVSEPHFLRNGQHEVRWDWRATYKLVTKKKSRRKRR